ncbi:MAG: NAD(P)-dependent oxidoreductase [Planctomycetota bacterium]|nr:NAD(P)-dependent oxidoreductase [Planctomycetota bacterium]
MPPTVGWIGCGVMGRSMVRNLLDGGFSVAVHTRTRSTAEALTEAGARWASSPAELAQQNDIVISMVGYPTDVEAVYFGETGVFSIPQHDSKCRLSIDMTTSTPLLAKKIADVATEREALSLDAPVSGGDVGARDGTLSIMVGGDAVAFEQARPIFDVLGKQAILHGTAGAGQHTKMVNQIIIASTMIGMCEGLVYAKRAGLDTSKVLESVSGGAAGSWSLSNLAPRILDGDLQPGFFVEHFVKDIGIAISECDRMRIELAGLKLARGLYDEVVRGGGGRLGTQALHGAIEKLAAEGCSDSREENSGVSDGDV